MNKKIEKLNRKSIRFVIISVLPEPLRSEITQISQDFFQMTGSKTALTYPPHITLRTGAIVPVQELDNYVDGLKKTVELFRNKNVEKDFLKISEPYWVDYEENDTIKHLVLYFVQKSLWLIELNKTLLGYKDFIKSNKVDFQPHISLAYDDLNDDNFEELKIHIIKNKQKFQKNVSFVISEVSLYFQDDDGYWKEYFSEKI
jgi:2'-5' RNA ligase